jgi:hypothetical protein
LRDPVADVRIDACVDDTEVFHRVILDWHVLDHDSTSTVFELVGHLLEFLGKPLEGEVLGRNAERLPAVLQIETRSRGLADF